MAQHDFVINNQGFPAFRSDLNDFLNAVRTTHSGTSLPSGAVAGTIWLDTTSATIPLLKYYDGTDNILLATINHSTNTVTFSGVATDLVNDLTPQLGGDLDVQTNKLVSTSNNNVKVYPNGTGVFEVGGATNSGRIQLNCEQNSHGIKLASPPHSAAQSYTLTFPSTAPSNGLFLQTDGSGNLSFASAGGTLTYSSGTDTGDGTDTTFTISSGRSVNDVLVFVNGFQLTPTTDYTISGTTLTFQTAPANSAEITFRYLPIGGSYSHTNFTGDGSATTITINSGRAVDDILVVVNGLTLVPTDDYTISGTTLTFAVAPTNLAEITVRFLRLS